jgi:putative FmdB family regulatory protein
VREARARGYVGHVTLSQLDGARIDKCARSRGNRRAKRRPVLTRTKLVRRPARMVNEPRQGAAAERRDVAVGARCPRPLAAARGSSCDPTPSRVPPARSRRAKVLRRRRAPPRSTRRHEPAEASAADCPLASARRTGILSARAGSHRAMPIYEYACASCAKSFEELVIRRSDEAGVKCPACGSPAVSRQMSRPAAARTGGGGPGSAPPPPCGPVG